MSICKPEMSADNGRAWSEDFVPQYQPSNNTNGSTIPVPLFQLSHFADHISKEEDTCFRQPLERM
uniref:Uncharacterized protein n=1 Tax=Romanomermis culicivorax TaxID=13658 RepID=A0A915K7K6_ROMCU